MTHINALLQNGESKERISQSLKDCSATYNLTGKRVRLDGVDWEKTPVAEKLKRGFKSISFADSLHEMHNMNVSDMNQPLVYQISAQTGFVFFIFLFFFEKQCFYWLII